MFATPLTPLPAMRVKSGAPTGAKDGAAAARGRRRPARRRAAESPARLSERRPHPAGQDEAGAEAGDEKQRRDRESSEHDGSRYVDAACAAVGGFRDRDRQDTVFQIGRHALDVDRLGQHEGARKAAVSAFDAMKLLAGDLAAGDRGARPANRRCGTLRRGCRSDRGTAREVPRSGRTRRRSRRGRPAASSQARRCRRAGRSARGARADRAADPTA